MGHPPIRFPPIINRLRPIFPIFPLGEHPFRLSSEVNVNDRMVALDTVSGLPDRYFSSKQSPDIQKINNLDPNRERGQPMEEIR
jgi:hypothetical protein